MPKSRHTLPRKIALSIAAAPDKSDIAQPVFAAMDDAATAHPEWGISPNIIRSASKRVVGQLHEVFIRFAADRAMIDWLEQHREAWARLDPAKPLRCQIAEQMLVENGTRRMNLPRLL